MNKFTYKEIWEQLEKGLCFSCDEKYTAGYRCNNKKLMRLEIVPEEEEE